MKDDDREVFFQKLRDDMVSTRSRRFQYQLAKITSVGTLMGASALVAQSRAITLFYYIIPFVAVAYDLFILGESFTMRRMSAFVRVAKTEVSVEHQWETFVKTNPDVLGTLGNLLTTSSCAIGSIFILAFSNPTATEWFNVGWNRAWLACVAATILVVVRSHFSAAGRRWAFNHEAPIG